MTSVRIARIPFLAAVAVALALGAALACGIGSTPAAAQGNYPDRQGMSAEQACANDAYRLCEAFIPDRGKVGACLRRNKRALSPDCATFFGGRKLRRH